MKMSAEKSEEIRLFLRPHEAVDVGQLFVQQLYDIMTQSNDHAHRDHFRDCRHVHPYYLGWSDLQIADQVATCIHLLHYVHLVLSKDF